MDDDNDEIQMPPVMDYLDPWFAPEHYGAIAALLAAAGYEAVKVFNGMSYGVRVKLEGIGEAVWSNYEGWAYTLIRDPNLGAIAPGRSNVEVFNSGIAANAPAEDVARLILLSDYEMAEFTC